MSLNGLVKPEREKCESANWRWVRAHQLAPQGLGPVMYPYRQCNYGDIAPYESQKVLNEMAASMPLRIWGYPNVTACSRLAPLLYAPRVDPNPPSTNRCQRRQPQWPFGYYCGK